MNPRGVWIAGTLMAGVAFAVHAAEVDFARARELLQKQKNGQSLTTDEAAYLERAKAARGQRGKQTAPPPAEKKSETAAAFSEVPLSDRGAKENYKGETGGLYGDGRNDPPATHRAAALAAARRIAPLDADGKPHASGKIVLLSIGMSNTTMEFRRFKEIADADAAKSASVMIVDGAQGGQDARIISDPAAQFWTRVDERLRQAGVTASQVQVVWLKQAIARPTGEFPAEAKRLQSLVAEAVRIIKTRYPNVQLCYLSSRTYGGYALTPLNPEPHAFETAFGVRWLITEQIRGTAELNYDPQRGVVKAPVVLWGPYLWANGESPRGDGLSYKRSDFTEKDGTHPSPTGQQKVAELLLKFFKTDETARGWFVTSKEQKP